MHWCRRKHPGYLWSLIMVVPRSALNTFRRPLPQLSSESDSCIEAQRNLTMRFTVYKTLGIVTWLNRWKARLSCEIPVPRPEQEETTYLETPSYVMVYLCTYMRPPAYFEAWIVRFEHRGKWGKTDLRGKTDHRPSGPNYNYNMVQSIMGSFVFVRNHCVGRMMVPAFMVSELFWKMVFNKLI